MIPAVIVFAVSRFVPFVKTYGTGFSILIPVIFAYIIFKKSDENERPDNQEPVDIG